MTKSAKQGKSKGMVYKTNTITISMNFKLGKCYALQTLRIDRSRPYNLAICASETLWSTSSDTQQVEEIHSYLQLVKFLKDKCVRQSE